MGQIREYLQGWMEGALGLGVDNKCTEERMETF